MPRLSRIPSATAWALSAGFAICFGGCGQDVTIGAHSPLASAGAAGHGSPDAAGETERAGGGGLDASSDQTPDGNRPEDHPEGLEPGDDDRPGDDAPGAGDNTTGDAPHDDDDDDDEHEGQPDAEDFGAGTANGAGTGGLENQGAPGAPPDAGNGSAEPGPRGDDEDELPDASAHSDDNETDSDDDDL